MYKFSIKVGTSVYPDQMPLSETSKKGQISTTRVEISEVIAYASMRSECTGEPLLLAHTKKGVCIYEEQG